MSSDDRQGSAVELFAAVAEGDLETVDALLEEQPDLVTAVVDGDADTPGAGCTPLHLAAQSHHTAIAQRLVAAGIDVDARNAEGRTALHDAIEHGAMELAEWLVDQGAEIDVCAAAILGDLEQLVALVEEDPGLVDDRTTHLSPLGWAAYGNQPETARALLDRGARPDDGELLCAASVGHVEVGRALLEHGADPDALHPEAGGNALHAAAAMRYTCDTREFVALLLEAGADPTVKSAQGTTALEIAETGARRQTENPPAEGELFREFEGVAELLRAAEESA